MPWIDGDNLSPANLNQKSTSVAINVQDPTYGAVGNGTTDDTAAFVAALSAATRGDTVFVPSSRTGYLLTSTITVPEDVTLTGNPHGLRTAQWVDGSNLSSAQSGRGTQLRLSNMTNPAIVLKDNAAVENLVCFYPGQTWDITSLNSSFVTYAPTIQLGVSGADLFTPAVRGVHFLGSTVCIDQGDSTGQAVNGVQVEDCSGVLLGPFLRLRNVSDVAAVSNCHFNPAYATNFVVDSTVNGDAKVFRTKAAQLSTVLELGQVSDLFVSNVYSFGNKHFAHYNRDFYTGDANEECGGVYTNIISDVVYQAFRVDRTNNVTPLAVQGGRIVPAFAPTGAASDASLMGMLSLRSSVQTFRGTFTNLRVHSGTLDASYVTNYTSRASYSLVADAPLVTATGSNVFITNVFFDSATNGIADSNISNVVRFGPHASADVERGISVKGLEVESVTTMGSPLIMNTGLHPTINLTSGTISIASATGTLPSAVSSRGYMYVGSDSSLYYVNGSGVSTLIA